MFFNTTRQPAGRKRCLCVDNRESYFRYLLESITEVSYNILTVVMQPSQVIVAARMTWTTKRQMTDDQTRVPGLLSDGHLRHQHYHAVRGGRAFMRLLGETIRTSDDGSIFAWGFGHSASDTRIRVMPTTSTTGFRRVVRES